MDDEIKSTNIYLKNPLSLSDIIKDGAQFEINTDFDDDFVETMIDELYISDKDDDDDDLQKYEGVLSPWTKPFAELKLQMTPVNEYVHKRITKKGREEGGMVPINARVCIRYNAYLEGESAPFDSLFLRNSSFTFYTGRDEVLVGLEMAVRTMHCGEHAQFVISYHVLMGELGCPPRVKPRTDCLYIIEVSSFNAVGDMYAADQLSAEEQKKFSIVIEKVKEVHLKGLDFFGQNLYRNAIATFERAVNLLNMCHLSNDEEEKAQKAFLIKLYTNLAVCFIKVNKPNRTCIMCKQIRHITNNKPSCKALFQEGRALLMLDDYKRAGELLREALYMEPHNVAISEELKKLDKRYSRYKEGEKIFWYNAFGTRASQNNQKQEPPSRFTEQMRKLMKDFKEDLDQMSLKLPKSMTKTEIDAIAELALELNLKLQSSPLDDNVYVLSK